MACRMDRVVYLIDGFNLYHSLRSAERDAGGISMRWLDIRALCRSYLHLLGREATLDRVFYFSALAKHLESSNPQVTARHKVFIECIEATGVVVELNRFKKKPIRCPACQARFNRFEEKETDVAIAIKIMELFFRDACDTVVVMSGDTDLAPACRTAMALFPTKRIIFALPYNRKNKELIKLAPGSFSIDKSQYAAHQLADPFILADGAIRTKPTGW